MRILIATPLYPPEIAPAATYTKELARRLAASRHSVTVLAYTHLPEHLPKVTVLSVEKYARRFSRLVAFRTAFAEHLRHTDAIVAINGLSVALPIIFTVRPRHIPLVWCVADQRAHARAGIIERAAFARSDKVIYDMPLTRPEILPFEPSPREALAAYNTSWHTHILKLKEVLHHE